MKPRATGSSRLDCSAAVPSGDWLVYSAALQALEAAGIPFAVAGGVAYGCYAHHTRFTNDLDLCILPTDRTRAVAIVQEVGFADYFDTKPYQRHWIYRGWRDGQVLDVIWQMANERAVVDPSWLESGPTTTLHGMALRLVPLEEIIWMKLYVLQRERNDWPDIWNMLAARGGQVDWPHLLARVASDQPLLAAVLQVYRWLAPDRAGELPSELWQQLELPSLTSLQTPTASSHAQLLDSRPWFAEKEVDETGQAETR